MCLCRETHVGNKLALKYLAREGQLAAFVLVADGVGDGGGAERSREFGNEIAHLIRVRHEHEFHGMLREEILERVCE